MTEATETRTDYAILWEGLRLLAARDSDYASTLNGVGFGRFDGAHGHRLAETPFSQWTPEDTHTAWRIARRYRNTQLAHLDLDLPEPEALKWEPRRPYTYRNDSPVESANRPAREPGFASLEFTEDGKSVIASWGGDDPNFMERKDRVKAAGGRWNRDAKQWTVGINLTSVEALSALVSDALTWPVPFTYPDGMEDQFAAMVQGWRDNLHASAAKDKDLTIKGLVKGQELRPFQKAGVAYAIKHKRTLIADEPGLGKTIQAIATVVANKAYPALIICPATLKLNWAKEIRAWVPKPLIQQAQGVKWPVVDPGAKWVIINYDILHAWKDVLARQPWGSIIADESHALKNSKTNRTKATKHIINGSNPETVVFLSGTPIMNRPIELWAQLDLLGRSNDFGGFWAFVNRYCNPTSNGFGNDFNGSANLDELNTRLRSCGAMVRRTKNEVLTELPPKQWPVVPLPISASDSKKYRNAESDIAKWSAQQKAEDEERRESWFVDAKAKFPNDQGKQLDYIDKRRKEWVNSEEARLRQSEQLLRFEALKQLAYQCKRDGVFTWIDTFMESGKKLVVFGWHRDVVSEIAEHYNAPMIMGGMDRQVVEDNKAMFQDDPECRMIVCNIAAGGVGHTLTAASDVAFVEFGWNPAQMDQAADRCHRIGQQDNVMAWQLIAEHDDGSPTIDGEIVDLIAAKRAVVDEATDGLGVSQQSDVLKDLMARLQSRATGTPTLVDEDDYEARQADRVTRKFDM